jgi:uncharacterized membrane protein (DUF2068 family)
MTAPSSTGGFATGVTASAEPLGYRLIIGYKLVRGGAALILGVAIGILALLGYGAHIEALGHALRQHATNAWTLYLARFLLSAGAGRHLELGALALLVDGSFTLFEGYALLRRWAFAPWLVVVATASFVPWEIVRLVRRVLAGRVAALVVNLAVVAYLAQKALRDRRHPTKASTPVV